jgi:hypothetical protein
MLGRSSMCYSRLTNEKNRGPAPMSQSGQILDSSLPARESKFECTRTYKSNDRQRANWCRGIGCWVWVCALDFDRKCASRTRTSLGGTSTSTAPPHNATHAHEYIRPSVHPSFAASPPRCGRVGSVHAPYCTMCLCPEHIHNKAHASRLSTSNTHAGSFLCPG